MQLDVNYKIRKIHKCICKGLTAAKHVQIGMKGFFIQGFFLHLHFSDFKVLLYLKKLFCKKREKHHEEKILPSPPPGYQK